MPDVSNYGRITFRMTKTKDIEYGENDAIAGTLKAQEAKVRINMFIDGDLLLEIRAQAQRQNTKYQTLINQSLRKLFLDDDQSVDVKDFKELRHRVEMLEASLKRQA